MHGILSNLQFMQALGQLWHIGGRVMTYTLWTPKAVVTSYT